MTRRGQDDRKRAFEEMRSGSVPNTDDKEPGLVEFASPVDAVGCAVAWQTAVEEHEAEQPEDDRLVFRIGVNLGNVLVEGEDSAGNLSAIELSEAEV